MRRALPALALLAALLSGCALRHAASDSDAVRYAQAWETPGLDQQPVLFHFRTEGEARFPRLPEEAFAVLEGSGKFRRPDPGEPPAYDIELTVSVRHETHGLRAACGALLLCLWPTDAGEEFHEAFAVIRNPSGELVARCYAQGRGRATLWLGHLLWPRWLWNEEQERMVYDDVLKAVTVKMCRELVPRELVPRVLVPRVDE